MLYVRFLVEGAVAVVLISLFLVVSSVFFRKKKRSVFPDRDDRQADRHKQMGTAFEDFILDIVLELEQVRLVSRTMDYSHNGHHAEDNQTPDLKFRCEDYRFAIECKYRTAFIDGKIFWAENYQIKNYSRYQMIKSCRVFVAIGIGGEPEDPNEVFVVPLNAMLFSVVTENYLSNFRVECKRDLENVLFS